MLKPLTLTIDPFDWTVHYLFITKDTTLKQFTNCLDVLKIVDRQGSLDNFNYKQRGNAGEHYYNVNSRESTVIIYRCSSQIKRIATVVHENRHVVDRLCRHLFIDDIEAPAFMEDWLIQKVLNHLKGTRP